MRRPVVSFLLSVILFSFRPVMAQEGSGIAPDISAFRRFEAGLLYIHSIPEGEFAESETGKGHGLGVDLGFLFPSLPMTAGITGSLSIYGDRDFTIAFPTQRGVVRIRMRTQNNMATGHAFVRMQPHKGILRPWVEGLVGLQYFWTDAEVEDEGAADIAILGVSETTDAVFSYGAGAGLMVRLFSGRVQRSAPALEVLLDVRIRYLLGASASYYNERSVSLGRNGSLEEVRIDAFSSRTDMLQAGAGISVRF